ncbi:MAG: sodium:solute symporter family protein [Bacteroidota bacterium]
MNPVDFSIFLFYIAGLLAFGYYFHRTNKGGDDYYVGGRSMSSVHIGLSVVATDVGGGFSIGLGGLGFIMGVSGSWMLFTGLIGAWLAAVFLIPKIKSNPAFANAYTFPDIFKHYYTPGVALLAGIISAIGYIGFTSSQLLAGAKLASGTFVDLELTTALLIMGVVAVVYTVMGGIKAVIYTDTVQWALLMGGLVFIGIPISYEAVGGMEGIRESVAPEMLRMDQVSWQDLVFWTVTIIPIWFVGMTLYQRIYASRDEKTAKRAWFLAGLFEWPIMAFMGVSLGLFARVAADQGLFLPLGAADASEIDPETGLPMLLRTVLPVGLMGIMMASYFSAILSTADSCLMASSGNVMSDIIPLIRRKFASGSAREEKGSESDPGSIQASQWATLILGALALLLAWQMENVLELMLYSYAFMVSGLFVPLLGALWFPRGTWQGAMASMLAGGTTTVVLQLAVENLPMGLDANVFGISVSALVYIVVSFITEPSSNRPHGTDI